MSRLVNSRPYYLSIALILIAISVCFFAATRLQGQQLILLIHEGGIVEVLSALGYLVCIAIILRQGGLNFARQHWYFVAMLAAFSAREFDLDKRFTAVGILKSKFIVSPDVGLFAKIIGVTILCIILAALGQILWRYSRTFLREVWRFKPFELAIGLAGGFLVIAKSIDGIGRKLASFNISVDANLEGKLMYLEESLELAAPYLLCVAASYYFASQKPNIVDED
ncbi:hypothetical protein [uncultured Umboniibacter sp.]|uniref:hypothetical protein n=1 Tax=uncultured Umboniibacter sp. TaxID=1798917 RepID=UPI00261C671E|nr:hypothetical protein [uncultured Umboniibacter sp.]